MRMLLHRLNISSSMLPVAPIIAGKETLLEHTCRGSTNVTVVFDNTYPMFDTLPGTQVI